MPDTVAQILVVVDGGSIRQADLFHSMPWHAIVGAVMRPARRDGYLHTFVPDPAFPRLLRPVVYASDALVSSLSSTRGDGFEWMRADTGYPLAVEALVATAEFLKPAAGFSAIRIGFFRCLREPTEDELGYAADALLSSMLIILVCTRGSGGVNMDRLDEALNNELLARGKSLQNYHVWEGLEGEALSLYGLYDCDPGAESDVCDTQAWLAAKVKVTQFRGLSDCVAVRSGEGGRSAEAAKARNKRRRLRAAGR